MATRRKSDEIELYAFDAVEGALLPLLPNGGKGWHIRSTRWSLKLWRGAQDLVEKEHYEAQVMGRRHVPEARTLAIEVGFHAEHAKEQLNQAVEDHLAATEKRWRKAVGSNAVLGSFLGQPRWRRLSETWLDPDLGSPDLPFELTAALADYVNGVQPVLDAR